MYGLNQAFKFALQGDRGACSFHDGHDELAVVVELDNS
jgi:hypothetical protein